MVMIMEKELPGFVVVSAGDIAERAYAMYLERGCADGFDREDWLRAEHELNTPPSSAPGKNSTKGGTAKERRQR